MYFSFISLSILFGYFYSLKMFDILVMWSDVLIQSKFLFILIFLLFIWRKLRHASGFPLSVTLSPLMVSFLFNWCTVMRSGLIINIFADFEFEDIWKIYGWSFIYKRYKHLDCQQSRKNYSVDLLKFRTNWLPVTPINWFQL